MELLLEMQKKDPGPPPAPDAAPAGKVSAARPVAPRAEPVRLPQAALIGSLEAGAVPSSDFRDPTAAKPALFGATSEPAIRAAATPALGWQTSTGSGSSAQRPYQTPGELPRWLSLPAEFIAWLRQNRYAVVAGAIATLAVVWLGSAIVGRRRYAR